MDAFRYTYDGNVGGYYNYHLESEYSRLSSWRKAIEYSWTLEPRGAADDMGRLVQKHGNWALVH